MAYTYDNNGNLLTVRQGTSTPTSSYTWDYNNRLTQAVGNNATSTYSYDPWGQRVKQTVSTSSSVTTYYPSRSYNITGSVPSKHIFLPSGELIATVIGTGASSTVAYIHTDHLGGTNVVTDDSGNIVELTDYYPYGNSRVDEQSGFREQRKFTGHEFDVDTGLIYANARYYNGNTGKLTSQDPAFWTLSHSKLQLVDPQSWNSYAYARNNPIILMDVDGNFWTPWRSSGGIINWMGNGGILYNLYGGNADRKTAVIRDANSNGFTSDHALAIGAELGKVTIKTEATAAAAIGIGAGAGVIANTLAPTTIAGGTAACASGGCEKAAQRVSTFSNVINSFKNNDGSWIGQGGRSSGIRIIMQGVDAARSQFYKVTEGYSYQKEYLEGQVLVRYLQDGSRVTFRSVGSSGAEATIEIRNTVDRLVQIIKYMGEK